MLFSTYKTNQIVKKVEEIPFLPIQFFKSHAVLSSNQAVQEIFTSSGTTGSSVSKHMVTDLSWYTKSYTKGFEHFYGPIEDYTVLGLLPNYLERDGSSLIYMVDDFIKKSNYYYGNWWHEGKAQRNDQRRIA